MTARLRSTRARASARPALPLRTHTKHAYTHSLTHTYRLHELCLAWLKCTSRKRTLCGRAWNIIYAFARTADVCGHTQIRVIIICIFGLWPREPAAHKYVSKNLWTTINHRDLSLLLGAVTHASVFRAYHVRAWFGSTQGAQTTPVYDVSGTRSHSRPK